jgi:hypothetical protein
MVKSCQSSVKEKTKNIGNFKKQTQDMEKVQKVKIDHQQQ